MRAGARRWAAASPISATAASRSTPTRRYKVAGWASVQERPAGEPIWEVVATYLRDRKVIPQQRLNVPRLEGVAGNAGLG